MLDAGEGSVVWSRDVASDSEKQIPGWGFASSPLVVGDVVVVAASGELAASLSMEWSRSCWNHPVLVKDVLLVRKGEEMAAFRLPLVGRAD